ncbi:endolytic transglycosylase MltG, partial [Microbacterium sp. HJ5]
EPATARFSTVDDSRLLAQPRPSASRPAQDEPVEDDSWMFTGGAAPAMPYSRTGSNPQVAAAATATATATTRPASTATLEDLFTGASSTDELGAPPPPKNKRKRRIGGWIALGVVLLILGGVAAGGLYVWTTYEEQIREVMGWEEPKDYEAGLANGEAYVTIKDGDTGQPISQSLYDAGVTMTPDAFYDYLIESGQNPPFVPGVFKLQKQMTSEAALTALLDPANKMENTAQLREGLTVEQSLPLLAEGTGIPLEEFQAAVADPSVYGVAADSLEGWLFPATYTFDPEVTAAQVIQTLVDRTVQSLDAAGVAVDDRQRVLTVASIIEREARYEQDMQKVATVIENRLNPDNQETFGLLQMDSTAQYGYGEMHDGTVSSSEEALTDPNPWNTYVNPGLPVGPIANPGDAAIKAVMNPSGGDWMYFVTVNLDTGETVFTTNLADHNRAVSQWQEWCSAHPDSGC